MFNVAGTLSTAMEASIQIWITKHHYRT